MKFTWEAVDIYAGRRVAAKNAPEVWMIGYSPKHPSTHHFCLVSLTDGCVADVGRTKFDMAGHLNHSKMKPLTLNKEE
jgi:hypothetical protein